MVGLNNKKCYHKQKWWIYPRIEISYYNKHSPFPILKDETEVLELLVPSVRKKK